MSSNQSLKETQAQWHGSFKGYVIGFILCLALTGVSFLLATSGWLHGYDLFYTLIVLGLAQAVVQMLLFLHVGQEDYPKWETISFCFMVMCVLILVIGSLWVLDDLNDRMMPPMEEMNHMKKMTHHD